MTSHISEMSALAHLTGTKMITGNSMLEKEIILNYSDFDYKYESAAGIFFLIYTALPVHLHFDCSIVSRHRRHQTRV